MSAKCVSDELKKSEKINQSIDKKEVNNHSYTNGCNDDFKQTNSEDSSKSLKSNRTHVLESNKKKSDTSSKSKHNSSNNVISNLIPSILTPIKSELNNKSSDSVRSSSTSTPLTSKNLTKNNKSLKTIDKNISNNKISKPSQENKQTIKLNLTDKHVNGGETEIIIPYKKLKGKNQLNKSDSEILKNKSSKAKLARNNLSTTVTPSKKVNIALAKNTSHAVIDYFKSVKQSPEIPFDGGKKPRKTSLKPNSMPSPVNPFYKHKLKLLV